MAKNKTTRFDDADHLTSPREMAAHVNAAIDASDGDAAAVAKALGECARAMGIAQVARASGLSRESLYKWLDGGRSPNFQTVVRVVKALGLRLSVQVIGR